MVEEDGDITGLLDAAGRGDTDAADQLYVLVYKDLRRQAQRRLRALPPHATLQATALVSEAHLRLFGDAAKKTEWSSRRHFYFAASRAMHDVVVESARRRGARKRGGDRQRVALDEGDVTSDGFVPRWSIVEIDEALHDLAEDDPDAAEVVLLRFFGGLTYEQISDATRRSVASVRREWAYAKSWLRRRLDTETTQI